MWKSTTPRRRMVALSGITTNLMMMMLLVMMTITPQTTTTTSAFDYDLASVGAISLTDAATSIPDVVTLFPFQAVLVTVSDLEWVPIVKDYEYVDDENILYFETRINGMLQTNGKGSISLKDVGRTLPTSIDVGEVIVSEPGRHEINVTIRVVDSREEGTAVSTVSEYEAFSKGFALFPLLIILILAVTTNMVRFVRSFIRLFVRLFLFGLGRVEEQYNRWMSSFLVSLLPPLKNTTQTHLSLVLAFQRSVSLSFCVFSCFSFCVSCVVRWNFHLPLVSLSVPAWSMEMSRMDSCELWTSTF
jgi:hypothetical protein